MRIFHVISRNLDRGERIRLGAFYAAIFLMHAVGWGLLLVESSRYPGLAGLGGLAYSFGLRHAFDADHISAIDNTTRKLLQQEKRPVGVGFFFSVGHSTVVLLLSLALGIATRSIVSGVVGSSSELRSIGGLIGTGISGAFLLAIGAVNLVILLEILATYRRVKKGCEPGGLHEQMISGGALTRLLGRLFALITASWQMYLIGFLFGLGFDTASEVALLGISAGATTQGLPVLSIVSLPIIFAAGMSLMDTTDGAFMAKAYSWAFSSAVRRLFYNITMTSLSVFVAFVVGGVEILQLMTGALDLRGGVFDLISDLNLADVGFFIAATFVLAWIAAVVLFKSRHLEDSRPAS